MGVEVSSFFNLSERVVNATPRTLYLRGRIPVPIAQDARWDPAAVWTSAEYLAPTGIRSSDRAVLSGSLYRLRYPSSHLKGDMAK